MAELEQYCEVRATSGIFRDWTAVAVSYAEGDNATPRVFRLQLAEPSGKVLRLKPGDRVDIALAGHLVIQEGYISGRQVGYDPGRHAIQVDGYSKDGPITKVSVNVPGSQFRNYTLDAIANRVLEPLGIKFRMRNPPSGAMDPFPNVGVRKGETPFDLISRLARARGVRLANDEKGNILAGPKEAGSFVELEEGRNIIAANCTITMPAAASLVGHSQAKGSDSLFGKATAEVQATAQVSNGGKGLVSTFLANMPLTQKELQARINMELADLQASMVRVSVTHHGWLKPGGDGLWNTGDTVTVRSPMLFPTDTGELQMRVWSVAYTQGADSPTLTTLELVNEAAYSVQNPDAKASSPLYNPQTSTPRPDTPA